MTVKPKAAKTNIKRPRVDWDKWRETYVGSNMPMSEICRMEGAPSGASMSRKAREENWEEQRRAFRRENKGKLDGQISKEVAQKAAFDEAQELAQMITIGRFMLRKGVSALHLKPDADLSAKDAALLIKGGMDILTVAMNRCPSPTTDAEKTVIVLPSKEG